MTSARGNVTKTEVAMDIASTSLHVIGGGTEHVAALAITDVYKCDATLRLVCLVYMFTV